MKIKIDTYKITQRGERGYAITLPKTWVHDLDLNIGDEISIYRDEEEQLILRSEEKVKQEESGASES